MTRRAQDKSLGYGGRVNSLVRIGGLLLMLSCVLGSPARGAQSDEPLAGDVTQFLHQTQDAARQTDYSGVFIYSQGASLQSSRVIHVVDGTGERERLSILDGEPREFLRHNDSVQCLIPSKELILIEKHRMDRFPGVLLGKDRDLDQYYTLRKHEAPQRVAGHPCLLVDIAPRDDLRYGYRFCVDPATKLLIKSQTIDRQGAVINQIAFTSLQLGHGVEADQLQPPWDIRKWRTVEIPTKTVDVAELGWRIAPPPGFEYNMQISRPMKSGVSVMQTVLTDGLAAVSVFIEPMHPDKSSNNRVRGATRDGAMNIYGARIGDYWLTAIGEVPADTLRQLVEHIEYVPPSGALQ